VTRSKIAIAGDGQAADLLLAIIAEDTRYEATIIIADRSPEIQSPQEFRGLPLISLDGYAEQYGALTEGVIVAVGYRNLNRNRELFCQRLVAKGLNLMSFIHPSAVVSRSATLGRGSLVLAGSVVEPFSNIGENTVVWSNCTVAHHANIGDNCWIAAGAVVSGHAEIGNNCFLGIGSVISNHVSIGEFSILGAGVLATQDVAPYATLLENKSKQIDFSSERYWRFLDG